MGSVSLGREEEALCIASNLKGLDSGVGYDVCAPDEVVCLGGVDWEDTAVLKGAGVVDAVREG